MKYIRTKDGIWELESTYEHLGKTYYGIKGRIHTYDEEEIIKQADTIEELCDCYVIVRKGRFTAKPIEPYVCDKKEWDLKTKQLKAYIIETCYVYGAIWIELSNEAIRLEPTAKMNDEGKLELL